MTDRLSLYNGCLRILKDRPLANLSENRESRRTLDAIWDDGAVKACLEAGQWKFASRAVLLDGSPSITDEFASQWVFDKPTDWVRTIGVWSDSALSCPFEDYREEGGFWVGTLESMYVKYVSEDTDYGLDYSLWPQSFVKFVEAHLALELTGPLTERYGELEKVRQRFLDIAASHDAQGDPTKFLPAGSWVRARTAGNTRKDGQPR